MGRTTLRTPCRKFLATPVVPPVKLSTYGPRSFAVAGPTTLNSLPVYLRGPEVSIDSFRRQLKTFLFAQY